LKQNRETETMSITQQILDKAAALTPEKQQELLDFATFLQAKTGATGGPWKSLRGAFAHRGIDITEDEISTMRREMWGQFPRELP
jgi:hypothetical protein